MNYNNYCPNKYTDLLDYNYHNKHILAQRYDHLFELAHKTKGRLKIALKQPNSQYWTKWLPFFTNELKGGIPQAKLELAYDVHRSLLPNEIVIESDYENYKDNIDAAKMIGNMLAPKGFIPHFYYSGSKSIHCHVFIDFEQFDKLDDKYYEQISSLFANKDLFFENFMSWLRALMISSWGFNVKEFDKALMKSSHLIRCELSMNKLGYKTYLGTYCEKLTETPIICNEKTGIIAKIGKIQESKPKNLSNMVGEFLDYYDKWQRINRDRRKSESLSFAGNYKPTDLRKEVKVILNDKFAGSDGMKRALFILCNEVKQIYDSAKAISIVKDWNIRMGRPFRDYDITYRVMKSETYRLKTTFIKEFLADVGKGL